LDDVVVAVAIVATAAATTAVVVATTAAAATAVVATTAAAATAVVATTAAAATAVVATILAIHARDTALPMAADITECRDNPKEHQLVGQEWVVPAVPPLVLAVPPLV
jgi:hypothetical protein